MRELREGQHEGVSGEQEDEQGAVEGQMKGTEERENK